MNKIIFPIGDMQRAYNRNPEKFWAICEKQHELVKKFDVTELIELLKLTGTRDFSSNFTQGDYLIAVNVTKIEGVSQLEDIL